MALLRRGYEGHSPLREEWSWRELNLRLKRKRLPSQRKPALKSEPLSRGRTPAKDADGDKTTRDVSKL